ncbi:hypothetical protein [Hymenobacter sp. IS2118]|uniref:hypothetical protein n=1 Tax=Hymenobacter sp. IS2118 TaxID=1505605 RepID=UPI00055118E4|nr:hypothetical protein [Hymenobacter sp. IS2118]
MKLAVELEFPEEQAALALEWLQSLPTGIAARLRGKGKKGTAKPAVGAAGADATLSVAEEQQLLHELFGAWKSDVSGDEMNRVIDEARQTGHREVEL